MLFEGNKILEFNQNQKSDEAPSTIYADLECLCISWMTDGCKNNPENSPSTTLGKDIPSTFSMSTIMSFKTIENKDDVCRGKMSMKKFYESLREPAKETNNL